MANILTRRSFMKASTQAAIGMGLASLTNIPPFLKEALAQGNVGLNGKKLIFIFLRGGNDGVNNIIPIMDPSYRGTPNSVTGEYPLRDLIGLPKHPLGDDYYTATSGPGTCPGLDPAEPGAAIPLCNGFAALNPALADLVPIYNAGDLALIHRVGYKNLSRSHFDSERYWEKGSDGTSAHRLITDGIWYRTVVELGLNVNQPLSGVSLQSNMPMSLRGQQPMTNLSSLGRYNVVGVYNPSGNINRDRTNILNAVTLASHQPYPGKDNRDMVYNLSNAFRETLDIFQDPNFQTNNFFDLDGTTRLFSTDGFTQNVKSCAQILNSTDAVITGTEVGGWDTHTAQVTLGSPHLGGHANILRRVAKAYYGLWRYFTIYGKNGSNPTPGAKVSWDDVVVVTMSEFGRTSAENASMGTDHAEASVMYIAGGGVNGRVYGCDLETTSSLVGRNWAMGTGIKDGCLYAGDDKNVGYLTRSIDYRSVLGELIRDHLGATQEQLNRIIPAYALESTEHLKSGGAVTVNNKTTPILGEIGII